MPPQPLVIADLKLRRFKNISVNVLRSKPNWWQPADIMIVAVALLRYHQNRLKNAPLGRFSVLIPRRGAVYGGGFLIHG